MQDRWIRVIVPLVSDAVVNEDRSAYVGLGKNTLARLDKAFRVARGLEREEDQFVFALGSGTAEAQRHGPTLATLMREKILEKGFGQEIICNDDPKSGACCTQTEITWAIKAAHRKFPWNKLQIIAVSQRRHLWRVWVIKWIFHPRTQMKYVVSGQTKEIPWSHELLAYVALIFKRFGLGFVAKRIRARFPPSTDYDE